MTGRLLEAVAEAAAFLKRRVACAKPAWLAGESLDLTGSSDADSRRYPALYDAAYAFLRNFVSLCRNTK